MQVVNIFTGRMVSGVDADGQEWRNGQAVTPVADVGPWYPPEPRPGPPTVRVVAPGGDGYVIINASDFNPSQHELWRETPHPAAGAVSVPLVR